MKWKRPNDIIYKEADIIFFRPESWRKRIGFFLKPKAFLLFYEGFGRFSALGGGHYHKDDVLFYDKQIDIYRSFDKNIYRLTPEERMLLFLVRKEHAQHPFISYKT